MTEGRLDRNRRLRRRRRFVLLAILILMAGTGVFFALGATVTDGRPQAMEDEEQVASTSAAPLPDDVVPPPPSPEVPAVPLYFSGTGTWTYAEPADAVIVGRAGTLLRYNVAVENGIGLDAAEVGGFVRETLADPRSWIAGGAWRFQQVGGGNADFTVYLASPEQRAYLCGSQNTTVSCRNGDNVVINSARWLSGVEHWDGTLESYRQYAVNHEVGHRLGRGHEVCPGDGELSPVMAQQTYQLAGCTGNAWPYPDGETYASGPVGDYNGPDLPPDDFVDQ